MSAICFPSTSMKLTTCPFLTTKAFPCPAGTLNSSITRSAISPSSEKKLQAKLHESLSRRCAQYPSKAGRVEIVDGYAKVWMIEEIENLPTKFKGLLIPESEVFGKSHIEVGDSIAEDDVSPWIAE